MRPINLLIVEDQVRDAELAIRELRKVGLEPTTCRIVDREDDYLTSLTPEVDLIISDHSLPSFNSSLALDHMKRQGLDVPFIIVSGTISEEQAVESMRRGASDYLLKDRLARLGPAALSALEQKRLRDESRRSWDALQRSAEEQRLLADLSEMLGSSLDYQTTLTNLAHALVSRLADWCVVSTCEDGQALEQLAAAHRDPRKAELALSRLRQSPPDPATPRGIYGVWRTGRPELFPSIASAVAADATRDAKHLRLFLDLGMRSAMIVPLNARGKTVGVMTLTTEDPSRRYGEHDLDFAMELGRRAAFAIANARLYREAQAASRMKDEFLATLSHEVRTPLSAILGWADLLVRHEVAPSDVDHVHDIIFRQAQVQAQLVADVLDLSKIVRGTLRLCPDEVRVHPIVEEVVKSLSLAAAAKKVALSTRLAAGSDEVWADGGRLRQVVWNLVSNALKFTREGGHVWVTLRSEDGWLELEVKDDGEGIDPEFLPFVFDRFRQEDGSLTRQHSGLGIGLAIVRQIVELHGGTIAVRSEGKGKGAVFTVRLPDGAEAARQACAPLTEEGAATEVATGSGWPSARLSGLNVLVVEDEPSNRMLLSRILALTGADVRSAASVKEALATMERWHADFLLSDIGIPEEDGYSLIRRVRRSRTPEQLPAIAVTAFARDEERDEALKAGFQVHMAKPIDARRLVDTIASLVGR